MKKTVIFDHYLKKYLSPKCLNVTFICSNIEISKIWTENGQMSPFFTNFCILQIHLNNKTMDPDS